MSGDRVPSDGKGEASDMSDSEHLAQENARLEGLLREFVAQAGECDTDEDGCCYEHLGDAPCLVQRARDYLDKGEWHEQQ